MRKKIIINSPCGKMLAALILVSLMVILLVSCSSSDNTVIHGATFQGVVYDNESMEELKDVEISIGDLKTTSNEDGIFRLTNVPAGAQIIKASRFDYEDLSESVTIQDGEDLSYEIYMESSLDDWLEENTTYMWQVEAVKADKSVVTGPVWSFTTETNSDPMSVTVTKKVNEDSADRVAKTHINAYGNKDHSIASVEQLKNRNGSTLAYLYILEPAGYLIIPGSMENVLPPVLAYSYTTVFKSDSPYGRKLLRMAKQDIEQRLLAVQKNAVPNSGRLQKNHSMWTEYLSGDVRVNREKQQVYGPLIDTATWGQTSPYNDDCPIDPVTNKQSVVGCVATAYSQVFNYWRKPTSFVFTTSYNYTTYSRKIKIEAETANMNNIAYNNSNPNDKVKAGLSFACGVMARMNYTSDSSGANTLSVAKAIKDFEYHAPKIVRYGYNDKFNGDEAIKDLKATPYGMPVIMAISQVDAYGNWNGGHAIVCDGYNEDNDTYHLNMGWNGNRDGWYSLPEGMPARYSVVKGYVYNILPSDNKNKASERNGITKTDECPQNPFPGDGDTRVSIDEVLDWDTCPDVSYYNCYIWKKGEQKPSVPMYKNLPYAVVCPNFLDFED